MKASELRDKLNKLIKEKGDLPVFDCDGSIRIKDIEFFDECEGDCDCFLHENCNHCEAEHFIDGFVIKYHGF